ncbi:hypothetical protein BD770DRAFT_426521 [Pilaira anomala]|nr:hypothetical protein BD770DRAFT_426521 [Pilaira anomala]
MEDLIKCCVSLHEEYKISPYVLIFLTGGFSDEEIKSKFKNLLLVFVNEYPMQEFIALAYCIVDTENSLHSDDPIVKYFVNFGQIIKRYRQFFAFAVSTVSKLLMFGVSSIGVVSRSFLNLSLITDTRSQIYLSIFDTEAVLLDHFFLTDR